MKKSEPYSQSPPFSEEDVRTALKLIETDKDRLEAMNAYSSGIAAHVYNRLAEKEIYELSSDDLIFVHWYRFGLARRSDGDDNIALEGIEASLWSAVMRLGGARNN